MTITVAVTGGIGAGKSTLAGLLAARGAVVVNSDRVAREVVAPGTPGLSAVADEFGERVVAKDGSLDRPALARIVFSDSSARKRLEQITHPLVRARFEQVRNSAPPGSVVVNDIPLLTTRAAAAAFHLVIGVGAPESVRLARLLDRGLSSADARARMAAQIDDAARRPVCDSWVDNSAGPARVRERADREWSRLRQFAANIEDQRPAPRAGPMLVPYQPDWEAVGARLVARVQHAVGRHPVEHIGSTAVPGLAAKDVIDLQLGVPGMEDALALQPELAAAGFVLRSDVKSDVPHPDGSRSTAGDASMEVETRWIKTLHVNADPGRAVNLHVRTLGGPAWNWALRFRDWIRADPGARAEYLALKQRLASTHARDTTIDGYAAAKEELFAAADADCRQWAESSGWRPG